MATSLAWMGRPGRAPVLAALAAVLAIGAGSSTAPMTSAANESRAAAVSDAVEQRRALGLSVDPTRLTSLIGSSADVGSPRWGIPMTAEEAARVDFDGRMDFAVAADRLALPAIRELPTYAASYFDSASDGELVVALTVVDQETVSRISALMPAGSRGIRFVQREVTDAELSSAINRVDELLAIYNPEVVASAVAVDTVNAQIVITVRPDDVARSVGAVEAMSKDLQVPMMVVGADFGRDTVCSTRDSCVSPIRVGIRLYKGVIDTFNECTMAFVVYTSSLDLQFLTGGHCGYSGSNNWLHPGLPGSHIIGTDQATLYANNGYDLMRIQMPDAQASGLIYGEPSHPVSGYAYPIVGTPVCASRGKTNVISCGTITAHNTHWISDTANPDYTVWGGDSNIPSSPGDSGSPLYSKPFVGAAVAIGVLVHEDG